jgi:hypothetical protein
MSVHYPFSNDLLYTWEYYRKSAKRSRQLKKWITISRMVGWTLLIIGATSGVLADQAGGWARYQDWLPTALALTSAITLAVGAFISSYALDSKAERNWVIARSQAEALKSETYIYLVQAYPYDGEDKDHRLAQNVEDILGDIDYPDELTEEEIIEKLPNDFMTMDEYLQKRVIDQVEKYYQPKAKEHTRTLNRLKIVGFTLGMTGAIIGAISVASQNAAWSASWVAVFSTISGALASFTFAGRYQYLKTSYLLTARKLTWIHREWDRLPDEEKITQKSSFVRDFENTISVENSNWMAEFTKEME